VFFLFGSSSLLHYLLLRFYLFCVLSFWLLPFNSLLGARLPEFEYQELGLQVQSHTLYFFSFFYLEKKWMQRRKPVSS